jgi:hypothetical protein
MSSSEILPANEPAVPTTTLKQRLISTCYLSAVAIAMVGWVWAIGWVAFATAAWLLA